jgi:hypothetical protein
LGDLLKPIQDFFAPKVARTVAQAQKVASEYQLRNAQLGERLLTPIKQAEAIFEAATKDIGTAKTWNQTFAKTKTPSTVSKILPGAGTSALLTALGTGLGYVGSKSPTLMEAGARIPETMKEMEAQLEATGGEQYYTPSDFSRDVRALPSKASSFFKDVASEIGTAVRDGEFSWKDFGNYAKESLLGILGASVSLPSAGLVDTGTKVTVGFGAPITIRLANTVRQFVNAAKEVKDNPEAIGQVLSYLDDIIREGKLPEDFQVEVPPIEGTDIPNPLALTITDPSLNEIDLSFLGGKPWRIDLNEPIGPQVQKIIPAEVAKMAEWADRDKVLKYRTWVEAEVKRITRIMEEAQRQIQAIDESATAEERQAKYTSAQQWLQEQLQTARLRTYPGSVATAATEPIPPEVPEPVPAPGGGESVNIPLLVDLDTRLPTIWGGGTNPSRGEETMGADGASCEINIRRWVETHGWTDDPQIPPKCLPMYRRMRTDAVGSPTQETGLEQGERNERSESSSRRGFRRHSFRRPKKG